MTTRAAARTLYASAMGSLSWRVVALIVGITAVVTGGCVALFATGHASSAVDLPIVVAAFLPLLLAQLHTTARVADTGNKVDALLNGEGEAVVKRAVTAAADELAAAMTPPDGTPVLESAGLSAEHNAQLLAEAEARAQKSRP